MASPFEEERSERMDMEEDQWPYTPVLGQTLSEPRNPSNSDSEGEGNGIGRNSCGILSGGRPVRLVLHDRHEVDNTRTIWIHFESTYSDVANELTEIVADRTFMMLQAIWGPLPCWVEANPDSLIGRTCHTLYAVLESESVRYILGVVRTSLSDYPITIFEGPLGSSVTVSEAVVASHPKLLGQIKSITGFADDQIIKDTQGGYDSLRQCASSRATVVIVTVDEPPTQFISEMSDESIPPLLQVSFAYCKWLTQRAHDQDVFALQIIHLLRAILHTIISLALRMETVFEDDSPDIETALHAEDDAADLLRLAPLLSHELQTLLRKLNGIMETLEKGRFDADAVRRRLEDAFHALCADYPGAVTTRRSYGLFKRLGRMDHEEMEVRSAHEVAKQPVPNPNIVQQLEEYRTEEDSSMGNGSSAAEYPSLFHVGQQEDHLHPEVEVAERNGSSNGVAVDVSSSDVGSGGSGRDDPNFGVIGENVRHNGSDPARPVRPVLDASFLIPSHVGGQGEGGFTPSPPSSILRNRGSQAMIRHQQLPGSHSPAAHHWPNKREENPNHNHGANGRFLFASSPLISAVNRYLYQQQRSALISRPIGIGGGISMGGGMGMGMGVPRRISPSSSSSASGVSFSFSNNGNTITPLTSVANPGSIPSSFGISSTSPVGPGFAGRGTAFSPFATPSMLKTNQGDFEFSGLGVAQGGLAAARNAHSISEKEMMASRYFFGAERTPQVTSSFGGTRRSPQPSSSERHSRTDTTSTTGSRDETSSADYVEVSPGSDFSRLVGPVKDERPTSAVQKMESGPSKRSYAGVAAPARDSSQRRDTVLPPPGRDNTGPAPGSLRPPLTTSSQHSTTPPSSTDLQSPSSSSEPLPPPPIYPESFFWPLLDALEKSRAQVSTPHNRAQSVRHSVVGQELPPSARARLGLTFKEYVAAAARQGVIVTGDSGDKAWIAMREWKYPGKSYSGWPTATTTTTNR